ncbi:LLM class F420-dependent oxidoreductase [Amycolatopsis rhabdoformis]|uniref:LLM class F420-dependent oxidoreductase n=1 Tax=Amycolatopsis rhabdoformis TaxID=1448059 RepID=A0ABZ1IFG4_9PSEU|nr:LLM class F420-dependent oxidoreductase [Amycolatopsis rhabdoformis]WSE32200.1 LLM class F420-dependent oxidoreductase [Amycolatopsis rhabdoformis]
MEVHVFTNPQQGSTHEQLVVTAKAAEDLGFDGFFRADHYRALGGIEGSSGDAWVTLGALAAETSRIRLGTLVTSATFRFPGPLAVTVAQVDEISRGRVEFGFGTGYFEDEHRAYGIPFPVTAERFARFEEQLAILTGLWTTPAGATFSHRGEFYELTDSPALPKPVQRPRPPIIIGGRGRKKTPRLAARYADEFNLAFPAVEEIFDQDLYLRAACAEAGRDPGTLRRSAVLLLACGRDHAEVARRTEALAAYVPEALEHGLVGSPAEVVDRIGQFADAGITRIYLQTPQQFDLDHWEFFADEVLQQVK